MKKRSLLLMTVLMVALLSTSITAVSAKPGAAGPVECVVDIAVDPSVGDFWSGTVTGCSLAGKIEFVEKPTNYVVGKTEHFFESFTIWPTGGGEIHGDDAGVWNFSTYKFRANGWVTDASEKWAYLVGYKFHEVGITSNPDELPITASGVRMKLVPANRVPKDD
jgi:hypothetical protein